MCNSLVPTMKAMLILFDIDGTLIRSARAGVKAMVDAGRELFHPDFTLDGVEISGMLDTLIWAAAAENCGIESSRSNYEQFRAAYHRHLAQRLEREPTAYLLPGVAELVKALSRVDKVILGLLTGNFPETGRLKIASAGLDPDLFEVGAWGCDGPTRRHLPPVAMTRYAELRGEPVEPDCVVVIGDTRHDIDCARANGCRSLAVATGMFTLEELAEHEPDHLLADLSAVEEVQAWILNSTMPSGRTANT